MKVEDRFTVPVGTIVRHFKGNLYLINAIATYSEDINKRFVVYSSIPEKEKDTFKTWAREEEMFCSEVDKEKYPNIKQKYRFETVGYWDFLSSNPVKRNEQFRKMREGGIENDK